MGNVEETSKSKLDVESIWWHPLQASLQSHTPKTHEHALPDYSRRTSPRESVEERAQRIAVIANCTQPPHVSFTCLKTPNIITVNTNQHGCCSYSQRHFSALQLAQFVRWSFQIQTDGDSGLTSRFIQPLFGRSLFFFCLSFHSLSFLCD